jgi:hypothetical protein
MTDTKSQAATGTKATKKQTLKKGDSIMATEKKDEKLIDETVADIKQVQNVVKSAIEQSSKSIEEVHLTIARLPFKYLGKIKKIKEEAKDANKIQEKAIGHIYDLVRSVNTKVYDVSKDVVGLASSN